MHLSRTPVPALQVGNPPFPEKAHHSAKPTHRDQYSLPTVRTRATRPRVLDALHGTCTDTRPCLSYAGLRFAPYVSHLQHSRVRNYFHMPCVQMHCSARSHSALLHRGRYSFAQCPFAQKEVLFRIVPFCTERGTLSYSALLHRKRYSFAQCPFAQKEVLFRTVPFCTDRGTLSLFLSFLIGTTGCSRHHNPAARTSLLVRHNTHWYTKR